METAAAVSRDWRTANLEPPEYAMLEFGEKLTILPSAMTVEDVEAMRQHGFTDRDILSITLAAAYRNYIARLADALGVELHKEYSYTSQTLDAFGVSQSEVKTTIYGDRLTASDALEGRPTQKAEFSGPSAATESVCWIDVTPSNAGSFAALVEETERLTAPYSLRHLASAFALRPEALHATLSFGRLLGMGGSGLGRRLEAIIGLVTAATLWNPYMGLHHAQALLEAGGTPDEIQGLLQNPSGGPLSGGEREVARYCEMVTRLPTEVTRSDVETLRQHGFDDRDILTIAASVSFENFLGRVAAGLGVALEEYDVAPAALESFHVVPTR